MTGKRKGEKNEVQNAADAAAGSALQPMSFEESIERLEKIVADMEDGKLSLEEMIARFEEGQSLIRFCSKKLNEVEKKVEILVKKGDQVMAEPFEAAETEGGEEPEAPAKGRTDIDF